MFIFLWILVGGASAAAGLYVNALVDNKSVLEVAPVTILIILVGMMFGLFTILPVAVMLSEHKPIQKWFGKPFKIFNLKDDNHE